MEQLSANHIAEMLGDYVNTFIDEERSKEFNEAMAGQHRTLQQSFTRLVLRWLEYAASDEYAHNTDGRNEATHKVAKQLIEGFAMKLDYEDAEPSKWLPFI